MCEKTKKKKTKKKKKRNFGHSYLGNGLSDFLQIWNIDSPSWRATLQQIWFQSDEVSPRYKCVKMTFSFFLSIYFFSRGNQHPLPPPLALDVEVLSIYSRCGAPASWARHTIVCLDQSVFYVPIKLIYLSPYNGNRDCFVLEIVKNCVLSG